MCLVGYMIIVADSAGQVVSGFSRWCWVALGSAVVLPLCYLDQAYLGFTSTFSILVNVYLIALIGLLYADPVALDAQIPDPESVCYLGFTRGSVSMFSAMMQTIIIQPCAVPMYKQLERRSPARFQRILVISFSFLFILFAGFACLAVMAIGPDVQSNVLLDLPKNGFGHLARLGMVVVVISVYPMMVAPMVEPLRGWAGKGRSGAVLINAATALIVTVAMLVSFVVTQLGFMNVLNGAMSIGAFVALFPAAVGLWLLTLSKWQRLALVVWLVFGLFMSGVGLVFMDNYVGLLNPQTCLIEGR